jgi:hypothetical protein
LNALRVARQRKMQQAIGATLKSESGKSLSEQQVF